MSFALWNVDSPAELPDSDLEIQKINVLASFYPIEEFTKKVGKDKVNVSLLVNPGAEPHDWEPQVKDLQRIQETDLIIINGLGFETWIDDVAEINSDVNVIDTSNGIDPIYIESDYRLQISAKSKELTTDPHIWLNPITIKTQVQNIADALIEFDPQNKIYYQNNADAYKLELDSMDKKIRNELAQCSKKDFFAFHDAFSYFAQEYGLNQHTVLKSIDPLSEPSPQDIQEVIDLARILNANVIFTEEGVNPKMSQVIADEIGSKVLMLSPLEFGDEDGTFMERMDNNLINLKDALCN
ncbi:periplasmic solute binding protein [Nitrosopumilus maritimus SCM1]|uniref:Periplasmic solute binding protein n=2 Tax=Nitrosopumilus maritimus TaxID=338192 RepID=A9A4P6_NITMS|nr:periplasmic solute binding protein [Nitrosopumilus maritimus SCM1]